MWDNDNGNSGPDPYYMNEDIGLADNRWTQGLTQVSPTLVSGERSATVVIIGDSLSANTYTDDASPPMYYPIHSKNQMFNVWNGGVYVTKDPLLGSTVFRYPSATHWATRMADRMITDGLIDRMILAPIALAGTTATDWAGGGAMNHRITTLGRRLQSVGLTTGKVITHICLGTNDCNMDYSTGTNVHVPAYQAHLSAIIATCVAAGLTGPILLSLSTRINMAGVGNLAPGTGTIVAALSALTDNITTFAGADFNALGNSYRWDGVHPNFTTGLDGFASLTRAAITPYL